MKPAHEAKLIADKIKPLFKGIHGDRYQIQIINNEQVKQYVFFFMRQPKNGSMIVNPVYTMDDYDLGHLELVLHDLDHYYEFTREYRGFMGLLWPSTGKKIQSHKGKNEL